MTLPSSRISAGSFFKGLMSREYSSLASPGATLAGTNSIRSMRPSSIALMRTLRANGEAAEEVSFMRGSLKRCNLNGAEKETVLILRRLAKRGVSKDGTTHGLAAILRDA